VRVDATVVPLEGSGCAVLPDDDGRAAEAAERLSRVLGRIELLLFVRTEDQVDAERWRSGAVVERPQAGMALSCLPDTAERLVLRGADGQEPGAVSSRGMSRVSAARAAVAGTPAEAEWAARVRRWDRVASLVVLALLAVFVVAEGIQAAGGAGSPVLLGLALAMLLLLGVREVRRRRAS
jgi:hypothetical protein